MTDSQKLFIEQVGKAAQIYYSQYQILPSLVVAMAIKESAWGSSKLASVNHNYFGMKWSTKCGTKWVEYNTKEWDKTAGKYITIKAKFRSYDTMEEGIKGFYEFLAYKRYANLKGVTDPLTACKLIQKDGWATAPNYATSLFNDYIVKYGLIVYDKIGTQQPVISIPGDAGKVSYKKGNIYTTTVNLYIRKTPGGVKKKPYELTVNGKLNSYQDPYGDAVLRCGTKVTCLDVVRDGASIWILIPSGYICAVTSSGKTYIK